jgi:hypothetical protein
MSNMPEAPPTRRRWFQFSLGTMLILTAILAWGLATRPYWDIKQEEVEVSYQDYLSGRPPPSYRWEKVTGNGMYAVIDGSWSYRLTVEHAELNPQLRWPAIALVAFLLWKGSMLVLAHCRDRSATLS